MRKRHGRLWRAGKFSETVPEKGLPGIGVTGAIQTDLEEGPEGPEAEVPSKQHSLADGGGCGGDRERGKTGRLGGEAP